MKTIKWEDATAYSKGERGNNPPSAWELRMNDMRIYVTKKHVDYPEQWIMHCFEIGIRGRVIGKLDEELSDIKKRSISIVRSKLMDLLDQLPS